MYQIEYTKPKVRLIQESGLGVAEIAGRTCYDSFDKSENISIQNAMEEFDTDKINNIESSELLNSLAWVHHHHSIIEHATLSYLVEGTSRSVLQEHARHRIQAISVRSTRYTMSGVINAFVSSIFAKDSFDFFYNTILDFDMFVVCDKDYLKIEIKSMFDRLMFQYDKYDNFFDICVAKSSIEFLDTHKDNPLELFNSLQNGKKKRNVGDAFKHIVSDNWKVDMVVTFNIRSLKNYFDLRDSGSAFFQIQWLAKAMKEVTPIKYLRLIDKEYK
jgi:thymidylate synthase (FAD)